MLRTTTRRTAVPGLGALAAATALVLTAPGATAAIPSSSVVLDPRAEAFDFTVFGVPTAEDQAEELFSIPVPPSGTLRLTLPEPVVSSLPGGELTADLYEDDDYEMREDPEPLDVTGLTAVQDGTDVTVTIPREDAVVADQDDVYLVLGGLVASGFDGAAPFRAEVPLDLVPRGDALELLQDPLLVDGVLLAVTALDEVVQARAGTPFELVLPEESLLGDLGVSSLEDAGLALYPADEDLFFLGEEVPEEEVPEEGPEEGPAAAAAAAAAAPVAGRVAALAVTGDAPSEALDEVVEAQHEDEYDDFFPELEVGADGRSALVTPAAGLEGGDYVLELVLPSADDDLVLSVVLGEVALEAAPAAEPAPVPTATGPQPAPTATATATTAPVRQNPGLRSNTGVEGGGVQGGLLAAGGGLLVVGAGAGALLLRPGRRGRRA